MHFFASGPITPRGVRIDRCRVVANTSHRAGANTSALVIMPSCSVSVKRDKLQRKHWML